MPRKPEREMLEENGHRQRRAMEKTSIGDDSVAVRKGVHRSDVKEERNWLCDAVVWHD